MKTITNKENQNYKKLTPETVVQYIQENMTKEAVFIQAEKKGCLIVRAAAEGEEIPVYTSDGRLEASETGHQGNYVVTKADLEGKAVIDSFGHTNTWQMDESTLRKKYAVNA